MITTVNFSLFPSNELFTFAKGSLSVVNEKKEHIPAIFPFAEKANQMLIIYQSALERERKNPFTSLLATTDADRDSSFYGLRTYFEATGYRKLEGWNAASEKLMEIIRRHGWSAASMGYKAETAALTNIISEIKTKCASELELIGATEWLAELEATQLAFEEAFHRSITTMPTGEATVWETRPLLVNALRSLFSMISLLQSETPSEDLMTLETSLNELINRSLSTVKATGTRIENAKGKEDTQEPIQ